MADLEKKIAKIAALLNSAIRKKNSKDYKKAVEMLEKCNPKPSLQQILDAQEEESRRFTEESKEKNEKVKKNNGKEGSDANSVAKLEAMSLNELEKELENLRNEVGGEECEAKVKSEQEVEEEEEKRIQEVIKRYEKTFGRIKDAGSYRSSAKSHTSNSVSSAKPSNTSKISEFSTVSQREALEKLKKLDEAEDRIKKEKEELLKFLELRSNTSKCSSRPVTVSSIVSKLSSHSPVPEKVSFPVKNSEIEEKPKVQKPQKAKKSEKVDPVADLFKNL